MARKGEPHPELADFPTASLLAPPNTVVLPDGIGAHLVGHHGGITPKTFSSPYSSAKPNDVRAPKLIPETHSIPSTFLFADTGPKMFDRQQPTAGSSMTRRSHGCGWRVATGEPSYISAYV